MSPWASVTYDIAVNLVGGVISAVLVLWFSARWAARSHLRRQMLRLRNVLYDVETDTNPQYARTTTYSSGVQIHLPRADCDSWPSWRAQCRDIRDALVEINERISLELGLRATIRRPREIDLQHFRAIGSVFVDRVPAPFLGVIECATEAINLINAASRAAEHIDQLARDYQDFWNRPEPRGEMRIDTAHAERELENVRQRIILHREHVQRLIPGPVFPHLIRSDD